MNKKTVILVVVALLALTFVIVQAAPPLPGAIFTTTVDGTIVNENTHYKFKEDVYLDGGPGPNAPPTAAGLPEGDYYFQVTDPSGKDLLSTDHISCRKIHVNEHGVISFVYEGENWVKDKGEWTQVDCKHNEGVDSDHSELGAITVQLYPYDDTPNPGGVYKVWITLVDDYAGISGDGCEVGAKGNGCNVNGENWQPANAHGFIPSKSKTDNYKVREKGKPPCDPSLLSVYKFHDANANGTQDAGEADITGWLVNATDPDGSSHSGSTPFMEFAYSGLWTVEEETPEGTLVTATIVDGTPVIPAVSSTKVEFVQDCEETHTVQFGDVGLGDVEACKYYDVNADGEVDIDYPIEGWMFELWSGSGDPLGGDLFLASGLTGGDGCVTFSGLLPGEYTIKEILPPGNWVPTSDLSATFNIVSSLDGATISGTHFDFDATNYCYAEADFGTKGYWHNKNGLDELKTEDIDFVNGVSIYSGDNPYYVWDLPFDDNWTPSGNAYFCNDSVIGTCEISDYIVNQVSDDPARFQLSQQLLAFIFNVQHRLGNDWNALIEGPGGVLYTPQQLLDQAIADWDIGDGAAVSTQELLEWFNSNDAVHVIFSTQCEFAYP